MCPRVSKCQVVWTSLPRLPAKHFAAVSVDHADSRTVVSGMSPSTQRSLVAAAEAGPRERTRNRRRNVGELGSLAPSLCFAPLAAQVCCSPGTPGCSFGGPERPVGILQRFNSDRGGSEVVKLIGADESCYSWLLRASQAMLIRSFRTDTLVSGLRVACSGSRTSTAGRGLRADSDEGPAGVVGARARPS